MAINASILEMVVKLVRQKGGRSRLVSLGYPDMLTTEEQIDRLCGAGTSGTIAYRDDSEAILRWHRLEGQMPRIADTHTLFERIGITSDFLDITASRGIERIVDLNNPIPEDLTGQYDIVYDGGTMEHCFNVPQVIKNILSLCKVGGHILHVNPLNYFNHGFYSFHPTFYHDFYTQSGNRLASPIYGLHGPILQTQILEMPLTQRFSDPPNRLAIMVVAQKMTDAPVKWPMQSKYLHNPNLKA
jgi:hypothetical protein